MINKIEVGILPYHYPSYFSGGKTLHMLKIYALTTFNGMGG